MFCPKCRGEFREGFTYCAKCREDLVETLPPMEKPESKFSKLVGRLKGFHIEDYLKYGGMVYIIVGIVADIVSAFVHGLLPEINGLNMLTTLTQLIVNIIGTALWGLFFMAMGYIIHLLEVNAKNE